jgi:hypothetical protein
MRKEKPTGKEIKEKSKKSKLDKKDTVEEKKEGKKVKFTPNKLELESMEMLEEGHIVGVLEHEFGEKEGTLPPGKYNIYVAKVNGEWQGFAESDGKIKAEASKVNVKKHHYGDCKVKKPEFEFESICTTVCVVPICLLPWPFPCWCLVEVKTCFNVWGFC